MKSRFVLFALAAGLVLSTATGARAADANTNAPPPKVVAKAAAPKPVQLSTEADYSRRLVQVLGLSRFVPANPSPNECFAVLLLNGVSPKNGWNGTNIVSRATLARTVVQGMGRQSEVQNPNDDASWIDYLKKIGIEITKIVSALDQLQPLDQPIGNAAFVASTDPLKKGSKIGPLDQPEAGADLSEIRTVLVQLEEVVPPTPPPPKPSSHGNEPEHHGPSLTPS